MIIKNRTVVTQSELETGTAKYQIEYSISNGNLSRVVANIYEILTEGPDETYIGTITHENGMINCSLPEKSKTTEYFEDFDTILTGIKEDAAQFK